MSYVIMNCDTNKAYSRPSNAYIAATYSTLAAAEGMCTRLANAVGGNWKVMSAEEYVARPRVMVERTNALTGEKFMEAENTPYFCSPSSETYWST
jgi:hypothetical protein